MTHLEVELDLDLEDEDVDRYRSYRSEGLTTYQTAIQTAQDVLGHTGVIVRAAEWVDR